MKNKKRSKGVNENTKDQADRKAIRKSKINIPAKYSTREERMAYVVKKIHRHPKNLNETQVERAIRVGSLLQVLLEIIEEGSAGITQIKLGPLAVYCGLEDTDAYRCLMISKHVDPAKHPALMEMPVYLVQRLILAARGRKLRPFLKENGFDVASIAASPGDFAILKLRLKKIGDRFLNPERKSPRDLLRNLRRHQRRALGNLNDSLGLVKRICRREKYLKNISKREIRDILKTYRDIKATRREIGQWVKLIKDRLNE